MEGYEEKCFGGSVLKTCWSRERWQAGRSARANECGVSFVQVEKPEGLRVVG